MKGFMRKDLMFSLCGLNCALCPMKLGNYCPGCGGGSGNQSCGIARCSLEEQSFEYCFQCSSYPCKRYEGIDEFDSFITHRNQISDMERFQAIGAEAYHEQLLEKQNTLHYLLQNFDDGRRKSFFCVAINLLPLEDIKIVIDKLTDESALSDMSMKEKAEYVAKLFKDVAEKDDVLLKLKKKPSANKVKGK